MKTVQLFLAAMLIGLTSATAADMSSAKKGEDLLITKRYRYTQPIQFVERGVQFLIFPDGSFDFNTEFGNNHYDDYYYRTPNRSRRSSINATFGTPGTSVNYSRRRGGTLVMHDRWGNVRRVGNVFINYDRLGRVKRLGSVYVRYNRRGLLSQVGGLRLIYNKRGRLIRTTGHINFYNQGDWFAGGNGIDFDNDWYNDDFNHDDDDFYYYRQNGVEKKLKRKKFNKKYRNDDDD